MTRQQDIQIVRLFEVETQRYVKGEFRNFISDENLADWQAKWLPEQYRSIVRILERGGNVLDHADSSKWKCRKKVSFMRLNPSQRGFSLVYQGVTQGMIIVDISKKCKHPAQKNENLVCIDYIQVAPWNNRKLNGNSVRFSGVARYLMRKTVEYSKKMFGEDESVFIL